MKNKDLEISEEEFIQKIKNLIKNPEMAIGSFLFCGYRIQISKYGESGTERYMRLYNKRKENNLCVQCGKKIEHGNNSRLCNFHKEKELNNYKKRTGKI